MWAANNTPDIPDYAALKRGMEKYLTDMFSNTDDGIRRLCDRLFGGDELDNKDDVIKNFLGQLSVVGHQTSNPPKKSEISEL